MSCIHILMIFKLNNKNIVQNKFYNEVIYINNKNIVQNKFYNEVIYINNNLFNLNNKIDIDITRIIKLVWTMKPSDAETFS
jgi:hypothetical protein